MTDSKLIFRKEIATDKLQFSVSGFERGSGAPVLLSAYHSGGDICLYLSAEAARLLGLSLIGAAEEIKRYAAQEPNDRTQAEGPSNAGEVGAGSTLPA